MPRANSPEIEMLAGSEVFVRRLDDPSGRVFNLGELENPPSQQVQTDELESFDERSGARVLASRNITRFTETVGIDSRNHQDEVMALFLGADAPAAFAQAAETATVETHTDVALGDYLMIGDPEGDGTGDRKFRVSNVALENATQMVAMEEGVDYTLDPVKGTLLIHTDATNLIDGDDVQITYDTAAIDTPMIVPQSKPGGVEVYAEIWEIAESGAKQRIRTLPRARVTTGGNRQTGAAQNNFISLSLTALDAGGAAPFGEYKFI